MDIGSEVRMKKKKEMEKEDLDKIEKKFREEVSKKFERRDQLGI
jgi:hypothetical protein